MFVESIYIDANINQSFVLAVVIPNKKTCTQFFQKHVKPEEKGGKEEVEEKEEWNKICASKELKEVIMRDLREIGKREEMQAFEIPRDILVENEIVWSSENGLLTPSFKIKRAGLSKHYEERLSTMYNSLNNIVAVGENQREEEGEGSEESKNFVLDLICQMLSVQFEESMLSKTIGELGIDSISIVRVSSELSERFGVKFPVGTLYSKSLQEICEIVQIASSSSSSDKISSEKKREIIVLMNKKKQEEKIEWEEEVSVPKHVVEEMEKREKFVGKTKGNKVIVSGANGFLGIYLVEKLLESEYCSELFCVVRASTEEEGWKRMEESFLTFFNKKLESKKVRIVVGDLAQPRLGLSGNKWEELCEQVDVIIHNGAQVNGVLPYSVLRGPNVNGTKEMLALCVTHHLKLFVHISTLSVFVPALLSKQKEDQLFTKEALPLMSSYGATKRAAEIVLQNMCKQFKHFPLVVFRPVCFSFFLFFFGESLY